MEGKGSIEEREEKKGRGGSGGRRGREEEGVEGEKRKGRGGSGGRRGRGQVEGEGMEGGGIDTTMMAQVSSTDWQHVHRLVHILP